VSERIVIKNLDRALKDIETGDWIIKNHLTRYLYAKKLLKPGDSIVDIACGSGYGSKLLADHGCRVIGADISPEALKIAKKHNNHKNITWKICDIKDCKKLAKNLDAIVCFETLEHIAEGQEQILADFKEMVKPGRPIITSIPVCHPGKWHKRIFNRAARDKLYRDIFDKYEYPEENGSLVIAWNDK